MGRPKPRRAVPAKPKRTIDPRTILLLIVLLAAFLRIWQISTVPAGLHPDEALNGNVARQALETGRFAVFYPENFGSEGLYINVTAASIGVFGSTKWALRIVPAVFGILTGWGICMLGDEMFTPPIGLIAAFFTATSFWHLNFSRIATRAVSAPCFLVWAMFFLLAAFRRRSLAWYAIAGAIYGLGFHTYLAYRITPLLVAGVLAYFYLRTRTWKPIALFSLCAALMALPLALYLLSTPEAMSSRTSQVSVLHSQHPAADVASNVWKTAAMFFLSGDENWRHNYDSRPEILWPVAIFLVIGLAGAKRFPNFLALAWLVLAAVPEVLSSEGIPHAYRAILMIPPLFLLAAAGAVRSYYWLENRIPVRIVIATGCALAAFLAFDAWRTYFDLWAADPRVADAFMTNTSALADRINTIPREVPKIVAVAVRDAVSVNGVGLSAQPIMFLTASFTPQEQQQSHIRYVTPEGSPLRGRDFCDAVANTAPKTTPVICLLGAGDAVKPPDSPSGSTR